MSRGVDGEFHSSQEQEVERRESETRVFVALWTKAVDPWHWGTSSSHSETPWAERAQTREGRKEPSRDLVARILPETAGHPQPAPSAEGKEEPARSASSYQGKPSPHVRNLSHLVAKCGFQMTLKIAEFAGKYFRSCSNIPQREEKEQKWGGGPRDGEGHSSDPSLRTPRASPLRHHGVSVWCGSRGSQRRRPHGPPFCQVHSSVHWFPASSKDESSQMLLSCSSGSMSSALPRPGALVRLPLMLLLCFWVPLPLRYSGMNKATRKDIKTIHAPNKNGGPGMAAPCRAALSELSSGSNSVSSTWNM